jgi:putative tricarboxylic transport membrane protein
MKFNDAIFGAAFIIFAITEIIYTRTFPALHGQKYGPSDFPFLIGVGLFICGSVLLFNGVQSNIKGSLVGGALLSIGDWITNHSTKFNVAVVLGSILGFIFFIEILGFMLISFIILFTLFLRFDNSLKTSLLGAIAVTGVIKLVFGEVLLVPLPVGIFRI